MRGPRCVWIEHENPGLAAQVAYFEEQQDGSRVLRLADYHFRQWDSLRRGTLDNLWGGGGGRTVPASTSLEDAVRDFFKGTKNATISEAQLGAGEFYPRMWRPARPGQNQSFSEEILATGQVVSLLVKDMREIFETVEPVPKNSDAFGHRIRQLLLLACMEVESAWAAVLRANSYPGERWKTTDYVKLLKPMRLDSYAVLLSRYPAWPKLRPFWGWDAQRSTASLPWYEAYNETKHNREMNLGKATLGHMVTAVAAVFVMLNAQFGTPLVEGPFTSQDYPDFILHYDQPNDKAFGYIPGPKMNVDIPVPHPF